MATHDNPCRPPKDVDADSRRTRCRWMVCALLFFATTINYVDRQTLSILAPDLTEEFGWNETDYSYVVITFTVAYAVGCAVAGRMMDRVGVRRGFTAVVAIWSVVAMAHGLIHPLVYSGLPWLRAVFAGGLAGALTPAVVSLVGFGVARFALGLAEGGNFPGAVKAVSEWHPKSERALATGLFNCGSNVGIIVATYVVQYVVYSMHWGWPGAFFVTGAIGFVWLVFWLWLYRGPDNHPWVSKAELEYIRSDPADLPARIAWTSLLRYRQTWAVAVGMLLTGPVWWFYLYWLPKFLKNNHGVDLAQVFWPLLVVYTLAATGGIGGGWLSSWLIRRGASVSVARKATLVVCSFGALPVVSVARLDNMWASVILVGVAAAAHSGYAAILYTIVSDTSPRKAVSSVVGIGSTAGCVGVLALSLLVGRVLDSTEAACGQKDYLIPFLIAGAMYPTATVLIHLLLPRLEPMPPQDVGQPENMSAIGGS